MDTALAGDRWIKIDIFGYMDFHSSVRQLKIVVYICKYRNIFIYDNRDKP